MIVAAFSAVATARAKGLYGRFGQMNHGAILAPGGTEQVRVPIRPPREAIRQSVGRRMRLPGSRRSVPGVSGVHVREKLLWAECEGWLDIPNADEALPGSQEVRPRARRHPRRPFPATPLQARESPGRRRAGSSASPSRVIVSSRLADTDQVLPSAPYGQVAPTRARSAPAMSSGRT